MLVSLNRYDFDLFGTYGALCVDNRLICHTYELPWRSNERNISCIPEGHYYCEKHEDYIYLHDVPGRSGILIHSGNDMDDTKGCILPGFTVDRSARCVLHSRPAYARFSGMVPDTFWLDVWRMLK